MVDIELRRKRGRESYRRNREARLKYIKEYAEKNKEKIKEYRKQYYRKNKKRIKTRTKKNWNKNKVKFNIERNKKRQELKRKVIQILGGKCIQCGVDDMRCLQLDHIHGGGTEERSKMNVRAIYRFILNNPREEWEHKYQLLCANCNWIKKFENWEMRDRNVL